MNFKKLFKLIEQAANYIGFDKKAFKIFKYLQTSILNPNRMRSFTLRNSLSSLYNDKKMYFIFHSSLTKSFNFSPGEVV